LQLADLMHHCYRDWCDIAGIPYGTEVKKEHHKMQKQWTVWYDGVIKITRYNEKIASKSIISQKSTCSWTFRWLKLGEHCSEATVH
jgi:hypothetical protein